MIIIITIIVIVKTLIIILEFRKTALNDPFSFLIFTWSLLWEKNNFVFFHPSKSNTL